MKFVHPELEEQIEIGNYSVCEWIIESPELFSRFVTELFGQIDGHEGAFVLSEKDKEMPLSKYAEIIFNPLSVQVNDKKVQTKLYAELSELAFGSELYMQTMEMLGMLQSYFWKLEEQSLYELAIDDNIDINLVFKCLGIKVEDSTEDFFTTLLQYIKVQAEIMKKKLLIFVNLRSFINEQQLIELSKAAIYNEIEILLIENKQRDCSPERKRYIIDDDGCEI